MKVMHLATSTGGGAGGAALRICAAQNNVGIHATIQSRDKLLISGDTVFKSIPIKPIKRFESSALTLFQSKVIQKNQELVTPISMSTVGTFGDELSDFDVINIHATYNYLNSINLSILSAMKKPFFFTLHDLRNLTGGCHYSRNCQQYKSGCQSCPQVRDPWKFLVRNSFKNQEQIFKKFKNICFVTPSQWLADIVNSSLIGKSIPTAVINNPIPDQFFTAQLEKKLSNTTRVGFISANLNNPYKGLDVLLKALELLSSQSTRSYSLKLIGGGKKPRLANFHEISRVFAVSDKDVIMELRDLDVLVVPSTEDNSPSVIGEALALGLRVIGSDVGGISEILKKFGMPIFKSQDSQSLAELLEDLPEDYNKLQIKAMAQSEFGQKKIGKLYLDLYEKYL